nr:unnamed protein product [Digitaria exilis]
MVSLLFLIHMVFTLKLYQVDWCTAMVSFRSLGGFFKVRTTLEAIHQNGIPHKLQQLSSAPFLPPSFCVLADAAAAFAPGIDLII